MPRSFQPQPLPIQTPRRRHRQHGREWAPLLLTCFLLAVIPTLASACSERTEATTSAVVATVGDLEIRLAEVEAHATRELRPLDQERDTILRRHLDSLVSDRLLDLEAKARNLSTDQLIETEITAHLTPVTDAEVQQFYDANQGRIRQPLDNVRTDIRQHLEDQRHSERRNAYVETLAAKFPTALDWQPYRAEVSSADAPFTGPVDAPIDVVVFSDFQCPWCSRFAPDLKKLTNTYDRNVRLTYRHLPLTSIHPQAMAAAEGSVCAAEQNAFWPWHDEIFARQAELPTLDFGVVAQALKLNGETFAQGLASDRPAARIAEDVEAARELGIASTPTLFINGRPVALLNNRPIFDQIAEVVDDELTIQGVSH
ncbi:MAG: thioredoxin domain-containing protein [Thermoanaerobaculia bacterium]|nr:thioredoxin domain-containing protein [Thermoanaerobaculia bacterium]